MVRPELLAALTLWIAPPPEAASDELLRWEAPASCPTRAALAEAVAVALGRSLTAEDAALVRARASARRRSDRRWQLALTIEPPGAPAVVRTVVAERCELLVETAALMIAVAIDPDLFTAPTAAPTSRAAIDIPLAVPVVRDVTSPAPRPPPAPSPPTTRAPRLRAVLGLAAGLDVGALPRPTPGFLLRLGLLARRVRAEVGAGHWLEQSARVPGGGGDLRLTAAQLVACPRFALRRVELPVCAGIELGAMRGEGVGVITPTVDRVLWLAFLADARVLWTPLSRLALGLQLGLAAPLLAARFRLRDQDGDLHKAAPIAFRGALVIELRFF